MTALRRVIPWRDVGTNIKGRQQNGSVFALGN